SAPKWYFPEAQLDVWDLNTSVWFETGWTDNISYEYTNWIRFDFFDYATESTYEHGVYLNVKRGKEIFYYDKKNDEPVFPYYEKYIDSELPIKPLE
ncbi:MAG: hypothetical protein IJ305_06235, partial [Oscillospiraceae bacterium]|nr:hypothetical protein [Oscillospiraceae bacterium]